MVRQLGALSPGNRITRCTQRTSHRNCNHQANANYRVEGGRSHATGPTSSPERPLPFRLFRFSPSCLPSQTPLSRRWWGKSVTRGFCVFSSLFPGHFRNKLWCPSQWRYILFLLANKNAGSSHCAGRQTNCNKCGHIKFATMLHVHNV